MNEAINKLVIETLSQPLFLFLFSVGLIGIVILFLKKIKKSSIIIISFLLIFFMMGNENIIRSISQSIFGISMIIILFMIILVTIISMVFESSQKMKLAIADNKDKFKENIQEDICPNCGGKLKERNGKYGKFYGCSNYPECKYTKR